MNPLERWDDWEWEKAAHEIGKTHRDNSGFFEPENLFKKSSFQTKNEAKKIFWSIGPAVKRESCFLPCYF